VHRYCMDRPRLPHPSVGWVPDFLGCAVHLKRVHPAQLRLRRGGFALQLMRGGVVLLPEPVAKFQEIRTCAMHAACAMRCGAHGRTVARDCDGTKGMSERASRLSSSLGLRCWSRETRSHALRSSLRAQACLEAARRPSRARARRQASLTRQSAVDMSLTLRTFRVRSACKACGSHGTATATGRRPA
jgi:hypothetical protein